MKESGLWSPTDLNSPELCYQGLVVRPQVNYFPLRASFLTNENESVIGSLWVGGRPRVTCGHSPAPSTSSAKEPPLAAATDAGATDAAATALPQGPPFLVGQGGMGKDVEPVIRGPVLVLALELSSWRTLMHHLSLRTGFSG